MPEAAKPYDKEAFSDSEVAKAIKQFIDYAEETFNQHKTTSPSSPGHGGYFSGNGWAARCLKWHLKQLKTDVSVTNQRK